MICYDKLWLMMKQIKPIIESNDFSDYESNVTDPEILKVLSDYRIKRENAEKEMGGIRMIFIIAFVHLPMILTMLVADMF